MWCVSKNVLCFISRYTSHVVVFFGVKLIDIKIL